MTQFEGMLDYTKSNHQNSGTLSERIRDLMTIYLDIILFFNFAFNLLILMFTKYLAKAAVSKQRLLLGSIIATALVPIVLYFPGSIFNSMVGKSVYAVLIILATFGFTGIPKLMHNIGLFYFISFSIGGGLFGVHYLLEGSSDAQWNKMLFYVDNVYGEQMSLVVIMAGFPLLLFFTKSRMDRHVKEKIKYDQLYKVTIEINHQAYDTTGYIDSGNHLTDPLTNRPVVICDEPFLQQFFSESDWSIIRKNINENGLENFPEVLKKRLFIVPYQGVDGSTRYLYTLKPDTITIYYEDEIISTSSVLIGIQLAHLTADQRYHCLLHPQLIHFGSVITA